MNKRKFGYYGLLGGRTVRLGGGLKALFAALGAAVFAMAGLTPAYGAPAPRSSAFSETFEAALNPKLWTGEYAITAAKDEIKEKDRPLFDNDTSFVKLSAAFDTTSTLRLASLKVSEASIFSFRYRTEIDKRAQQRFAVSVDDEEKATYDGVDMGWRVGRIPLEAGTHHIEFLVTAKRSQVSGGYNAVYLDDVRLFPDKAVSVRLFPRGKLDTTVDGSAGRIVFTAEALREDGSVKQDALPPEWTVGGGAAGGGAAVNAEGVFSAEKTGEYTVGVKIGSLSAPEPAGITVHNPDFLQKPYLYPGTGKTYSGFGKAAKGHNTAPSTENITLTHPPADEFEADAFFLLAGTVNTKPAGKNYARVEVSKDGASPPLKTWYAVKGDFGTRIWLPFGAGAYTVVIQPFDSVILTTPPGGGEGMLRGGSYASTTLPVELRVTNTRGEPDAPDGDGRWLYPSFYIQADDFAITNLSRSLTGGLAAEREKITAVHDYVVSTFVYDQQSFNNASRSRKMDALSALANKTAVCEGYTYLSAALLRAAGIPVRVVTSRAVNHAWNHVYTEGKWLFYDATWDDPVPDRGPEVIGRVYFLLESLTGGDRRHGSAGKIMIGDAE